MLRVGLSGGIGSGKSTASRRMGDRGALVIDADELAREVVAAGTPGLDAVRARFGPAVIAADGSLDRAALGKIVFSDPIARRDLEQITHPRIVTRTTELLASAPRGQVVVHDVPLLVELGYEDRYHLVVIVDAAVPTRVRRLARTRGMSESDARARITAQAGEADRRAAADVWLDNNGTPAALRSAVDRLWDTRLGPFNANLAAGRACPPPGTLVPRPHDGTWPAQADRLLARLRRALEHSGHGRHVVGAQHVGPTSVPGLDAPDVLELQLVVDDLAVADGAGFVAALADLGYPRIAGVRAEEPPPGQPDGDRWALRRHGHADPGRPVSLLVGAASGAGWRHRLLWRDWLRAHPGEAAAYGRMLHRWAAGEDVPVSPWFPPALPRARHWAVETGWTPPGR